MQCWVNLGTILYEVLKQVQLYFNAPLTERDTTFLLTLTPTSGTLDQTVKKKVYSELKGLIQDITFT